jgi:hypothetical protein
MVSGTFNSLCKGAFHRSLTLLFTIGCRVVLSLGGWSPHLHTEFHGFRAIHKVLGFYIPFAYRTFTFYGLTFQKRSTGEYKSYTRAGPLSLAATYGVSVDFFSYRYLDVSVLCVRLT